MHFHDLFTNTPAIIACIHLQPLPGAPRYAGSMRMVIETALSELATYREAGVDGVLVENFRDNPFYPGRVPPETIAAMTAVVQEVVRNTDLPVGVNVLRNDAAAALAIAVATGARFIRVNVHTGAVVADQGILHGRAHETLRMRAVLKSEVLIFADAGVKHAAPLAHRSLAAEIKDLATRGMADVIIVSGDHTGSATGIDDINTARAATDLPILVGSGITENNVASYASIVQGLIVGSFFKYDGLAENPVQRDRVTAMMETVQKLRH